MMKPRRRQQPFDPRVPFTRAEARIAGLPIATLRGPKFQKVFYDLYVSAAVDITATLRATAALKISPKGAYVSHFTAAEIWDGCVPQQPLTHISVANGNRSERRGVRAHEANHRAETVTHRQLPISSPDQTFVELASALTLVELVVLGDSLLRKGRTEPASLVAAADASRGRGSRLARRAARLVRNGVDSPMESRLRMLIVLAGLPEPKVNLTIRDRNGDVVMRFDLSYPQFKIIVEYDGRQHARDDAQWARDIERREELDRLGWRMVIVGSTGIYARPDQTLKRVREALVSRGAAQLPGKFKAEWRQHFPVRESAA